MLARWPPSSPQKRPTRQAFASQITNYCCRTSRQGWPVSERVEGPHATARSISASPVKSVLVRPWRGRATQRRVASAPAPTAVVSVMTSLAVQDAERGKPGSNINTIGDAVWWSLMTMTMTTRRLLAPLPGHHPESPRGRRVDGWRHRADRSCHRVYRVLAHRPGQKHPHQRLSRGAPGAAGLAVAGTTCSQSDAGGGRFDVDGVHLPCAGRPSD